MTHEWGPVAVEKVERFFVGQVAPASADPSFQEIRIGTFAQQPFVVIGFQKGGVALAKMRDELRAGIADVCEYTDVDPIAGDHETVRLLGVVDLCEAADGKRAYLYGAVATKHPDQVFTKIKAAAAQSAWGDVDRKVVFCGEGAQSLYVVCMFMGNENGPDLLHGQSDPGHSFFGFPAGKSGIDQNGFCISAYIVAISVTAGIERGDIKGIITHWLWLLFLRCPVP